MEDIIDRESVAEFNPLDTLKVVQDIWEPQEGFICHIAKLSFKFTDGGWIKIDGT